jgi:hypothetical protein
VSTLSGEYQRKQQRPLKSDVLRSDEMKSAIAIVVIAVCTLLTSCGQQRRDNVVPEKELSTFLEQVKTQDYHDVARAGEALLKPGLVIVDHKSKLKDFPSDIPEDGQVRYELMSLHGDNGGYYINLFVKEETGEILAFTPLEWWK